MRGWQVLVSAVQRIVDADLPPSFLLAHRSDGTPRPGFGWTNIRWNHGDALNAFYGATSNYEIVSGLVSRDNPAGASGIGDIDADGDLDLVISSSNDIYSLSGPWDAWLAENRGSAAGPVFGSSWKTFLGSEICGFALADLDGDGDLDLFATAVSGGVRYFENQGSATQWSFAAAVSDPFGLGTVAGGCHYSNYPGSFARGTPLDFGDVDRDGDLDLLAGETGGDLHYFENTGTVLAPAFAPAVVNPLGLTGPGAGASAPAVADLDRDGYDLLVLGAADGTAQVVTLPEPSAALSMPACLALLAALARWRRRRQGAASAMPTDA